ncbi:MAG: hypothetical protein AAGC53_09275 [Actinomycetota bacterium]
MTQHRDDGADRKYESIGPIARAEAEQRLRNPTDGGEVETILLSLALHEPDREWMETLLRHWSRDGSPDIRRVVAISFGHVARRFRDLDGASWARLRWLASDPLTSGAAGDALDDAASFTGGDPGWEKPILVIDGDRFDDFAGFRREFSSLLPDWTWNGNLDAFNDILWGGFGTPEDGFVLKWVHSDRSRQMLGWPETVAFIERKLESCHPSNRESVARDLDAARREEGETLFDLLVSIINEHGQHGAEPGPVVELDLA